MAVRRYSPFAAELGAIPLESSGATNGTATPATVALTAVANAPTATGTANGTATPAAVTRSVVTPAASGYDAGETLMRTMVGFWDAAQYSGSGALLNLGTGGSTGDFTLFGSPTFATNKFTFDGSTQYGKASTSTDYAITGANFSVGIVVRNQASPTGGNYIGHRDDFGTGGWHIASSGSGSYRMQGVYNPDGAGFNGPTDATGDKSLRSWIRDASMNTLYLGSVAGSSFGPYTTINAGTGTVPLTLACIWNGDTNTPFSLQTFEFFGAFIYQGVLTTGQLDSIAAHFGINAGDVTATPAAVTPALSVPTATISATSNTTPAAVTPTAVVPAPTVAGTSNAAPAAVALAAVVPAPSASGSGSSNTNPAAVALAATVPAPTATGGTGAVDGTATPTAVELLAVVVAPDAHAPPTNDNWANALPITFGSTVLGESNLGARAEPGEPFAPALHVPTFPAIHRTMWWKYTPTVSGPVAIDTFGSTLPNGDTQLAVWTGTTLAGLTLVAYNNDSPIQSALGGDYSSLVEFSATAGVTYYLQLDDYGGYFPGVGEYAVSVGITGRAFPGTVALVAVVDASDAHAPPTNDDWANAIVIVEGVTTTSESNLGARVEPGEPFAPAAYVTELPRTMWWKYTPTVAEYVTIDTAGSTMPGQDTQLAVWTGTTLAGLTLVAYNDDNPAVYPNYSSLVTFAATAGVTYYIQLDTYGTTEVGEYVITLVGDSLIDLPGFDGAVTVPGPAVVETFSTATIVDVDLPGIDASVAAPGVTVEITYPTWVASTVYPAGSTVVVNGVVFATVAGGTSSAVAGIAQDVGVVWNIVSDPAGVYPAWSPSTVYPPGSIVVVNGVLFTTTGGGTSTPAVTFAADVGVTWIVVEPVIPEVRAELWSASGVLLSNLVNAFGVEWSDPLNDVGSGRMSLPADDPDQLLAVAGTEVRCYLYNELVFTWEIEQDPDITTISESEEIGQDVTASGRGRPSLLSRARIYPPKGLANSLVPQHRLYSFASIDFPNSLGWVRASIGLPWSTVDPVRFATIEYITRSDITDIPDTHEIVSAAAPLGWPGCVGPASDCSPGEIAMANAKWIWGTPDTLQVGFCYFRGLVTLATTMKVTIAATADNYWTLYMDGVPILGDDGEGAGWLEDKTVELTLPAGDYYLAAVVENIPLPGLAPEFNPAGFLFAMYTTDQDGKVIDVVKISDDSWYSLGYPPSAPGWTPGQIVLDALEESQARGLLTGFTVDFTAFADSAGNPWIGSGGAGSYVPGFSIPIGSSVLDVLNGLVDQGWIDYRMKPGGKVLQVWSQDGGAVHTAVALAATGDVATSNLVNQTFTPQSEPTTRMLVKWSNGYIDLVDAAACALYGTFEGFLVIDATVESEVRRLAQRVLDELKQPKTAIVCEIDPAGLTDRPYTSFSSGDYVFAPSRTAVPTAYRVHQITVSQDDMGRARIVLELDCRLFERERERFKLLDTLGRGVTGDTKVINAKATTSEKSH